MKFKKFVFGAFLTFCMSVPALSQSPLTITHLTGDFYVYTTYNLYKGQPVPSNSMYLVTTSGVVLFDTPWDSTQFQPLLDSIEKRHRKKPVLCIPTHYHDDRTAGLDYYGQKGINTYSTRQTLELCRQHGHEQAKFTFDADTVFTIGDHSFEVFYPGEGHTRDNIVIWFGKEKIIYGGCLVKSTESNTMGNITDANLEQWPATIKKVMNKFPDARIIIPGHFAWNDNGSLRHTLHLLEQHKRNTTQQD